MLFGLEPYAPYVALLIVLSPFVAFATERRPPEVVSISGMALLPVLGIIDTKDMLSVMSNSAPGTIVAMFILSGALVRTGVLDLLASRLTALSRHGPALTIGAFMLLIMAVSGFVNNTPIVVA